MASSFCADVTSPLPTLRELEAGRTVPPDVPPPASSASSADSSIGHESGHVRMQGGMRSRATGRSSSSSAANPSPSIKFSKVAGKAFAWLRASAPEDRLSNLLGPRLLSLRDSLRLLIFFTTLCVLCSLTYAIVLAWLLSRLPPIGDAGWLLLAPAGVYYALLAVGTSAAALTVARCSPGGGGARRTCVLGQRALFAGLMLAASRLASLGREINFHSDRLSTLWSRLQSAERIIISHTESYDKLSARMSAIDRLSDRLDSPLASPREVGSPAVSGAEVQTALAREARVSGDSAGSAEKLESIETRLGSLEETLMAAEAGRAPPPPRSPLPRGWRSAIDPKSGNPYFWHKTNKAAVQWRRPEE